MGVSECRYLTAGRIYALLLSPDEAGQPSSNIKLSGTAAPSLSGKH